MQLNMKEEWFTNIVLPIVLKKKNIYDNNF